VADDTIPIAMLFAVVDEDVTVNRYHPLHQGVIVDTEPELLATTPVDKLKLANIDASPRAAIWTKLLVPRRQNTDMVCVDAKGVYVICISLFPETPDPLNKNAFSFANIGKSPVDTREVLTVLRTQGTVSNSLDLVRAFVRDSSSNNPLGASVTGSWSNRGVSAGTD
jgi:hypothetical protein